ncbi:MAG: hypothetical protein GY715_19105 [Planctomycetes bacterium]|nr:hypothetical protein [Planctomycetota bacterium]
MSADSPRTARRAAVGMLVGVLVLEFAVIALAFLSRLLLTEVPANPGHAIIELASTQLPPVLGILILATATAVILTTADSYLLGASTSVAIDLGRGLRSPARQRVIVVVLGIAALGLAYTSDRFFYVALYAYTLYGASLTPAVLCALLFPRIGRAAVVTGMASGLGTAIAWKALSATGLLPAGLADIEPVLPALGANLLSTLVVASLPRFRNPDTDLT